MVQTDRKNRGARAAINDEVFQRTGGPLRAIAAQSNARSRGRQQRFQSFGPGAARLQDCAGAQTVTEGHPGGERTTQIVVSGRIVTVQRARANSPSDPLRQFRYHPLGAL